MEHKAKTVKVGNKYYKEGVEVAAPVQKKPVVKTQSESLAMGGMSTPKKRNKAIQKTYDQFMNGKSLVKR